MSFESNNQSLLRVLEMGTQFSVGGITRHIISLCDWLRLNGHNITLAGTSDVWINRETEDQLLDLPIRYVSVDGGSIPNRLRHALVAAWRLRRWLSTERVDLIHCHESAPALVASMATRGMNIPVVVTYHGSEPERIASFGKIARKCDLVITPSHSSAEDLNLIGRVPSEKLKVIGLGVKPAPSYKMSEISELRSKLLGDGTHLVVTVARLHHQKGIDVLIDCVAKLKSSHPEYRFVVTGDGPDEQYLRKLADEKGVGSHLKFVGRTSRPHLYLAAADLFLLTSRWEALPFTIVEAFQVGTPAVATACSGVVELIDDNVGAVVPIGDIQAICDSVVAILSDSERRAEMSRNAMERSKEDRFDPDWVHRRFEETYRKLVRDGLPR